MVPETTLKAFATDIAKRLNGRAIRVVGDPAMKVSRDHARPRLQRAGAELVVRRVDRRRKSGIGRQRRIRASTRRRSGSRRASILLGHMLSEDWGMREVADWLKTFVTDVPIEWIATGEPFQ